MLFRSRGAGHGPPVLDRRVEEVAGHEQGANVLRERQVHHALEGRRLPLTLDRGGITRCHPTDGTAEFVPVAGDTHITNLCFGGPDLRKAYVTQSYAGRLVEIDWPQAGLRQFER